MSYYVERVPATEAIVSDWGTREEGAWDETYFFNLKGSDYYLVQESLRSNAHVSVTTKIKGNVTVEHFYTPMGFDPGPDYRAELRSNARQTRYSPTISFNGTIQTPQILKLKPAVLAVTQFHNLGDNWVNFDEKRPPFSGDISAIEHLDLVGMPIKIVIQAGANGFRSTFHNPSQSDPAMLFAQIGNEDLVRLTEQIESGEFEELHVWWELPEFFCLKAPFEYSWQTFGENHTPYVIPSLIDRSEYNMDFGFKLDRPYQHEEYIEPSTASESALTELTRQLKGIERSIKSIRLLVIVGLFILGLAALSLLA